MSDTPSSTPSDLPSSWQEDDDDAIRSDAKSRRWWVIGGIVVVVLAVVAVLAIINAGGSEERAWPAAYEGRPEGLGGEKDTAADVTPSAAPGVYIWNSFDGWHLWVVNGDEAAGLTGTITSSDDIVKAVSSAPEAGSVTLDGKKVTFDLSEGAAVAGVDFDPGFSKKLTFELERADGTVAASEVFTGAKSARVDAVPVVVDKAVVD